MQPKAWLQHLTELYGQVPTASLARTSGTVEPVGQREQAKNHEHDDEDVFDFHGFPFSDGCG
jgi:hypothetical protein